MKCFTAFTAVVLLSAGFAWAGPIVPKDVAPDAKWFGHVNFEALRSLKLVQELADKCPLHQQCQAKMQDLAKKLGMNPMEDVLGATCYSNRYGREVGVCLVYVKKLNRERMVNVLREKHPDYKTSDYGDRLLYSWKLGHHGEQKCLTGTFASDTLIVIGDDAQQVKAALDVLDGKKPGLAKEAPLIRGIPQGALFAARANDIPEEYRKLSPCPVLHNCKAASAVWLEKSGQITGQYELATLSAETAKDFKAIVEGLKAMGELRFSDLPAVKKVVDGLKVDARGVLLTATFSVSTADVEAAVKAVMEHMRPCPQCRKGQCAKQQCPAAKPHHE